MDDFRCGFPDWILRALVCGGPPESNLLLLEWCDFAAHSTLHDSGWYGMVPNVASADDALLALQWDHFWQVEPVKSFFANDPQGAVLFLKFCGSNESTFGFRTPDLCWSPIADATYDSMTQMLAIENIYSSFQTDSPVGEIMRVLITAGPTREYLDDVRYLSNASSGRMGYALAEAVLAAGHEVVLVTGPVFLTPPNCAEVRQIETTDELLAACHDVWPTCDGVIATAAVCDYRPRSRFPGKLAKTGVSLELELVETADVLAELGRQKGSRWIVGFALESEEFAHVNALRKLQSKNCDAIVLNRPTAIGAEDNTVEIIDVRGDSVATYSGTKTAVSDLLWDWIESHLVLR
jgi:phosphopantothenoylcysteine decarboxylase / phosphopantothenate---cysteine ligase